MPIPRVLGELEAAFAELDAILGHLDEATWQERREHRFWGRRTGGLTPYWLASMILQHTLDHLNSMMQLGLFWDGVAARLAAEKEE